MNPSEIAVNAKDLMDLAGAVWTIVRIVGPWVAEHVPDAFALASSLSAA